MRREICLVLADPIVGPTEIVGSYDAVAKEAEKIIRQGRLIDGNVIVKWFEAGREANSRNFVLLTYIADVMREVFEAPQVEASYATVDIYAIAKAN